MTSDHSVTVRDNEWYDHASKGGDGPISPVQNYCGFSYPEVVIRLLDGEQGQICEPAPKKKEPKKEFIQSPIGREMWRLYTYPPKKRLIDREVLSTFIRAGLVYEDEEYHNAMFIGEGEHGVVRHTHKRNTNGMGKTFCINAENSDPRYSFRWNRTSDRLYVFEAPVDLLSFLILYPEDWQQHSYVALCDVEEQAMLWMLEQASEIRYPILCLDHDVVGIETTGRLKGVLVERGYAEAAVLQSTHKGWNEDVEARCRLETQNAEGHPQLVVTPEVYRRVYATDTAVELDRLNIEVLWLTEQYHTHLHWGRFDQAIDCMEQVSALAVAVCRHELW